MNTDQPIINISNPGYPSEGLKTGIDKLLFQKAEFTGKRIALICNNASLTSEGVTTREALIQNGFKLVKLFSPEHGLDAAGEDGKYQQDGVDSLTSLPIISLYGDRIAPRETDLLDIDLVMFDMPDVGCRFYTYLWTMTHVMESCAAFGTPLLILDRPNPIGGNFLNAQGPMLDETNCTSFIGRWSIPIRHCCTLGELALYFAATKISGLKLEVLPISNWKRNDRSSIIFTPTSPAIQKQVTAMLYPGMGLLEGVNINEGRSTAMPFEICGAPWIDKELLNRAFLENSGSGITSQPIVYTPDTGLYAGEACNGLQFFVTDTSIFRPVQTGIFLIRTLLQLFPANVKERLYCTLANPTGKGHLDKLLGIPDAFNRIKNGEVINTAISNKWEAIMKDYLLYTY